MQALDLLILALATWRLAYFATKESGPWGVMATVRAVSTLGGLLTCIYCASVWTALLAYLVYLVFPPAVYIVAASGGAMLLHRYTGADHV